MNGKSPTADNTKSVREAISRTRRVHNSTEVRKSEASIESRETHERGAHERGAHPRAICNRPQ